MPNYQTKNLVEITTRLCLSQLVSAYKVKLSLNIKIGQPVNHHVRFWIKRTPPPDETIESPFKLDRLFKGSILQMKNKIGKPFVIAQMIPSKGECNLSLKKKVSERNAKIIAEQKV